MSVRTVYRNVNEAQVLANEWQQGSSTDSVKVSIYNMDSNAVTLAATAMTNETGGLFSYSWTPTSTATYRIDYYNETLDSHDYEVTQVRGSATTTPAGGSGGSTFLTLKTNFLKQLDNYNGNDLTGTNSSGELAGLYLNHAMQTIYATIKASNDMESYSSTSLASVADQAYINLSGISDLDEIRAIKDTTNQWKLQPMTADWYFRNVPDPSSVTGTPHQYCRIFNRIYLNPRPTSVITYTTEYIKTYPELSADGDQALIPTKYDRWIYAEAWVLWLIGEDPNATAAIQIAQKERERVESKFLNDMFSDFDRIPQGASHFLDNENRRWLPYQNPVDGT